MKKIISILLLCILAISFVGCNNKDNATEDANTEVVLTKDNIKDYLHFEGVFEINEDEKGDFYGPNYALLDFQMYPIAPGDFKNVEISFIVTSEEDPKLYYQEWHLEDAPDEDEIILNIKLGVDGYFEKKYSLQLDGLCSQPHLIIGDKAVFEIKSISGSLVPSK